MASAMARVLLALCVALLVAHVGGVRTLKSSDGDIMTAQTTPTNVSMPLPADEGSEFEAVPAPDAEYNYNNVDDNSTDTTPQFADEGFLVPPPPAATDFTSTTTDEFATEDTTLPDDQSADPAEGFLVEGESVHFTGNYPGAGEGSKRDFDRTGYVFDATASDPVYPAQEGDSDAALPDSGSELEFSDAEIIPLDASDEPLEFDTEEPGN